MHCTKPLTTDPWRWATLGCLMVAMSFSHRTVGAEDWPVARGDKQSTGRAASELPKDLEVLWTFEAEGSAFEAGVVVEGGKIYVGDTDGTVYAIDLATGNEIWAQEFEDSGFAAAAVVSGDKLWIGDFLGTLRCLNTADGKEVWHKKLDAEVMAGPMLHEGQLLVTTEGGTFTSFDASTGEKKWETAIDAPLRCTPTVIDGKALLAGCDSKLHAYNLANGEEVGAIAIDGPSGSTPAAREGRLYFGTEQGTFYCIDTTKSPMEIVWTYADPRRRQGIRTAAAVNDKLAVFGSQGKAAYGIDIETGEQAWVFPTRTRVESSPLIAGDQGVVATQRGKLSLVDLASGKANWEYDAGGGFVASPAVVDGKLIIGNTDGKLYCFGKK